MSEARTAAGHIQWEYLDWTDVPGPIFVRLGGGSATGLARRGEEGWELVAALHVAPSATRFIFKRPKPGSLLETLRARMDVASLRGTDEP